MTSESGRYTAWTADAGDPAAVGAVDDAQSWVDQPLVAAPAAETRRVQMLVAAAVDNADATYGRQMMHRAAAVVVQFVA